MTVGIAAIADSNNEPNVVFAADRMVTVGQRTGIEYEDTNSKLEIVLDTNSIVAVAVGSGSLSLIDDTLDRLDDLMVDSPPTDFDQLIELSKQAYQEMERETIENQSLATFDLETADLFDEDTHIPEEFQEAMIQDIGSIRETLRENVNILIGGVDQDGGNIYTVSNDHTSFTNTGYAVVGSGSESAQLTFIRNAYDAQDSSTTDGVFSVAEAKFQAEERQGVGRQMDMAIAHNDGVIEIEDIDNLRDLLSEVRDEQESARERVMDKWDPPLDP